MYCGFRCWVCLLCVICYCVCGVYVGLWGRLSCGLVGLLCDCGCWQLFVLC